MKELGAVPNEASSVRAVAGRAWPDTVCASRRHHSLEVDGTVAVCEDCHQVTGPFVDDRDTDGH